MAECYMLGGRPFRSAATAPTFAQRGHLMGTVRTHKLDAVIARDGDLLAAIFTAGCASPLLAGLLVEDGQSWSRETALANAAYFDSLTSDEDCATLIAALESLLAGFFGSRGSSSTPSPTSSKPRARKTSAEKRAAIRAAMPPSDSATGPTSAPRSPSTPAPV